MAIKQTAHIIRGLRKDFSDSKQPKEYAIDAKNIRITNREDSSLLSITNEKGTKEITLNGSILGKYLGHTVINEFLVLFTRDEDQESSTDYIYKIDINIKKLHTLFSDDLGFEGVTNIEALGVYETKDIQKVYWVDGINQPRMINIADETLRTNSKEFDFIQELQLKETISVEKSYSSGSFNSGVIQYAFNYYNKNGQESNIVEVTPINYISYEDRGAAPNDYVSNSFKITINNIDTNFDYLRLYSIHRTSLDAQPSVKLITDLKADKDTIEYVDTGIIGETIDPVELLYKGGEYIIPKTLAQKDGTLFFGNIELNNKTSLSENAINKLQESTINWQASKGQTPVSLTGYYPYKSNLRYPSISGFQSRETYRLGIQFQDKTGKWSDPIFHSDSTVSSVPRCSSDGSNVYYSSNSAKLALNTELLEEAKLNNYVKVRGVVVYPQDEERKVVAQGILCPTVFNIQNRHINTCFAQSSWFLRPHIYSSLDYDDANQAYSKTNEYTALDNKIWIKTDQGYNVNNLDIIKYGAWSEFRHYKSLPINWKRNAEIANTVTEPNITGFFDSVLDSKVKEYRENYCVDKSILTFHSPEIELTKKEIDENTKIRLIGLAQFTSNASDIDIALENVGIFNTINNFYKYPIGVEYNAFKHASRNLISGGFYIDNLYKAKSIEVILSGTGASGSTTNWDLSEYIFGYMVYPWGRKGSLNNSNGESGRIKTKKISNLKFSSINSYLLDTSIIDLNTSSIKISDTEKYIYLDTPDNTPFITGKKTDKLIYSANIDDIVPNNFDDWSYTYFYRRGFTGSYNKKDGYPIIISDYADKYTLQSNNIFESNFGPIDLVFSELKKKLSEDINDFYKDYGYTVSGYPDGTLTDSKFTKDSISIKYKSSRHAVFALNYDLSGKQNILPSLEDINGEINTEAEDMFSFPGNIINKGLIRKSISKDSFIQAPKEDCGYLWIAELYREVPNKFGGDNYENNIWYPAGESVRLDSSEDIYVEFTQGDTFFARFDSLKTYPYTLEDTNSIVEIGSFMVETRINLDARYDRNRGQQSNLVMNPGNFNLFNDVYNQKNNFFNYRIIDKDIADNTKFPNTIVWSKQKFAGADVDAWTNINMASSLDLDGTKGELTKLVSFKNEIFSFQPEAINHILFNSRVQIPTSDGVPIELTNAYKVDGARQLSSIGSSNPLAITSTDRGIYYMDNITKGIYVFNGQQSDPLSDRLGMSSWVKNQNIDSYKVNYDKINQDIYFINNDNCLSYSEKLGEFESFFDYNNSEIFNVKDGTYAIKSNKLYKLFEGDYNNFFDEEQPFWVTFTHNENPFNDKIYNTLEFRADTYNYITKDEKGNNITTPYWDLSNNSAFNNIIVENEYQLGSENLDFKRYTPSNLKRKFRIWRANIPRDNKNKRDRIRNTWANITLKASNPSDTKTELHDLVVSYFM